MSYKDSPDIEPNSTSKKNYFIILGAFILVLVCLFLLWKPIKSTKIQMDFSPEQLGKVLSEEANSSRLYMPSFISQSSGARDHFPLSSTLRDYSVLVTPKTANAHVEKQLYTMVLQPQRNYQNNVRNDEDNYIDYSDIDEVNNVENEDNSADDLIDYIVEQGDTLNKILVNKYGVKYADVMLLIQSNKQLSDLKIGQKISFKIDKNDRLVSFEVNINKNKQLVYERLNDAFIEQVNDVVGDWIDVNLKGVINTNLGKDGQDSGLTRKEISEIEKILQSQIDFKKIQSKDRFSVVVSREMVGNEIKKSELKAIDFYTKGQDYYAFLANDGHYYDENANGLTLAFLERPVNGNPRISSQFNPRRLHPVTGKVAPHNGVDFAVSRGTPIYSVADGVVTVAQYSPSAGNFITIKHNAQYLTRYMHNDKLLVKAGDKVKKGQQIALSGNTGRSTGPHLHYEVHINGKPVNPLTAALPKTLGLTGKEKNTFLENVKRYKAQLTRS